MKNAIKLLMLVSALSLFAATAAMADDDDRYWGPHGMMGSWGGMGSDMMGGGMMGGGMMGGGMMGYAPYQFLNLTDDQRSRINKIQDEERRKHWQTMGKVMDERARLRDLYQADKRDSQAILKVQEQIDQLQRKMLELHLNTQNQVEALLSQEQRDQLKTFRSGGGGYGPRGMMRR